MEDPAQPKVTLTKRPVKKTAGSTIAEGPYDALSLS